MNIDEKVSSPLPLKFCLVDVCGTLYDQSTTSGFVRFFVGQRTSFRSWRFHILEYLCHGLSRSIVITLGKMIGIDIFRNGYISVLRGQKHDLLREEAARYAFYLEAHWPISAVHQRVRVAQLEGWQPVLVSNSLDVVVQAIADRLGVPCCASSLAWCGGVCMGHLSRDLKGRKLKAVKELLEPVLRTSKFMVITDNKSDQDLIAFSEQTILVTKGPERSWMKGKYSELISY